jgi:hypothetical protein
MADDLTPQLPTMPTQTRYPTVAGPRPLFPGNTRPALTPADAAALQQGMSGRAAPVGPPEPIIATPVPTPVTPVPTAPALTPPQTPATNPYAPGGVIPPVAGPAAVAAFQKSLGGAPAPSPAPAVDPQAGQIRFIDKNSPRVAAAPDVIRGGVPGASGGLTFGQLSSAASLVPPMRSPAERAAHSLLDTYEAEHQAQLNLLAAQKSGDAQAISDAQATVANFNTDVMKAHKQNMMGIVNSTLGLTNFLGR